MYSPRKLEGIKSPMECGGNFLPFAIPPFRYFLDFPQNSKARGEIFTISTSSFAKKQLSLIGWHRAGYLRGKTRYWYEKESSLEIELDEFIEKHSSIELLVLHISLSIALSQSRYIFGKLSINWLNPSHFSSSYIFLSLIRKYLKVWIYVYVKL